MPGRPPVTVVAVTSGDKREARGLLGALVGELGPSDNVVLYDDATRRLSPTWRTKANNALRPARTPQKLKDLVVLVDDRVEAGRGWIARLVDTFSDPTVLAAAPTSNAADGDELLVGVPYRPNEPELKRLTLAPGRAPAPVLETAERLSGPCLAVRRQVLERIGGISALEKIGYDPAELSRLAGEDGRLVVVADLHLSHPGGPTRRPDPAQAGLPLISACLIVKDEEANLRRCIGSLEGVADEVVVYDTGSTDATVDLARSLGARVIEGYWDDDFARARNASLSHCRGQWILWIDADEAIVCASTESLRERLRTCPTWIEGFLITIDNLRGTEAATALSHPACRLFRRAVCCWDGRVHEQIIGRVGTRDLSLQLSDVARISHRGYIQGALVERDKGARNLRTAFGDLVGGSSLDTGDRLTSLARSYLMAGRISEGIELAREAIARSTRPGTERMARRSLIEGLLATARFEEALEEIPPFRALYRVPIPPDVHEGHALAGLERYEEALEAFARVRAGLDDDGFEYSDVFVAAETADALAALGRHGEAADVLLGSLATSGGLDAHLGLLVESLEAAGRPLSELTSAIRGERLIAFLPQVLQIEAPAADRVLEAWFAREPENTALLAAAASNGPRLSMDRQLVWSARLRQAGQQQACPLVRSATDRAQPPVGRAVAAATALAAFSDPRARLAFLAATAELPDGERAGLEAALASFGPAVGALADPAPGLPTAPAPARAAEARAVLVVAREVSDLRMLSVARALAEAGHEVTFIGPQPAAPAEEVLAGHGVTVHGWFERDEWVRQCCSLVAVLYAKTTFDEIIVAFDAAEVAEELRALVPVAEVGLDYGEASRSAGLEGAAAHWPLAEPAAQTRPSRGDPRRVGYAIVGSYRAEPGRAAALLEVLARSAPPGSDTPVVLIGDDPNGELHGLVPGAIDAGPLADPTPWLSAVRAVLVASPAGAESWLEVAARCATPARVLTGDEDDVFATLASLASGELPPSAAPPLAGPLRWTADPGRSLRSRARRRIVEREGPVRVRLVGRTAGNESLSIVNRELALRLSLDERFTFSVREPNPDRVPGAICSSICTNRHGGGGTVHYLIDEEPVDVEIRHQWPPDFSLSRTGRLVVIQPWEFGGLPAEWVGPLRDVADELWVPTTWVRECAIDSGVEADKVAVVPNGVDVTTFTPMGARYPLATSKGTRLLFVGGMIPRKGVDALLESYFAAFRREDDVCLVLKPFGSESVYANSTLEPVVRRFAAGDGPEIEIVDGSLTTAEMAALYRSCDVLVHPYRGEGFGMPIAEAMAAGLPVVVPDGGACLDFASEDSGYLVRAEKTPMPTHEWTPSEAGNWLLEPSRISLMEAMRLAVGDPAGRRAKGLAGRHVITSAFTWEHVADLAAERIAKLAGPARHAAGGRRAA